ncbi:hypothetical protein ACP275_06G003200 [Erythranthe tilingii]
MERAKSEDGNGGAVKLPIGFRFHPTDEEVLVHYLKRKVFSLPLPASAIPEFDVFQSTPWDLPGDLKEKRYFFCKRKRSPLTKCNGSSYGTDCGYWKAIGKDKQIIAPGSNLIIGIKKSFVFRQRNNKSRDQKTQWIMHELCLVGSINTPFLAQKLMMQLGDWVVCRVHQRKRKARIHGKSRNLQMNLRMEGKNEMGVSFGQVSISCSSGITDTSTNEELDQEEESSSQSVRF